MVYPFQYFLLLDIQYAKHVINIVKKKEGKCFIIENLWVYFVSPQINDAKCIFKLSLLLGRLLNTYYIS